HSCDSLDQVVQGLVKGKIKGEYRDAYWMTDKDEFIKLYKNRNCLKMGTYPSFYKTYQILNNLDPSKSYKITFNQDIPFWAKCGIMDLTGRKFKDIIHSTPYELYGYKHNGEFIEITI